MKGNCYQHSVHYLSDRCRAGDDMEGWSLCHGVVIGTDGELKGVPYVHGWVEDPGANCYHFTTDPEPDVVFPGVFYYAYGGIEKDEVARYTWDEALTHLITHKHYGPWDEASEKINDGMEETV